MSSRWFNVAIVVLWLASMSWLVASKVVPPLLVGHPPSYRTIRDAQKREAPVGWRIEAKGRPVGWALSTTASLDDGRTGISSHVHFDRAPVEEMAPEWFRPLIRLVESPAGLLRVDALSSLVIDGEGRLSRFGSSVRIDPLGRTIELEGIVDGTRARVSVRSGEFVYATETYLPADALVGDALSPQTQLPGLHAGQTWTVPAYSPLRPHNDPLEILQATVEGVEPIHWNGQLERVWVVVYRSDSGVGLGKDDTSRAKLWVRYDGTVLKQQLLSTLAFVRLADDEAVALQRLAEQEKAQGR